MMMMMTATEQYKNPNLASSARQPRVGHVLLLFLDFVKMMMMMTMMKMMMMMMATEQYKNPNLASSARQPRVGRARPSLLPLV